MRRLALILAVCASAALLAGCGANHARLWVTPSQQVRFSACASSDCGPHAITLNWGSIPWAHATTGYYVLLDGVQVASVTSSPYTFTGMDCATTFTLGVQAHDGSGDVSQTVTISYTTPDCESTAPILDTVAPVVTGDTIVGGTLSTSTGTWTDSPTSYTYQWQDCIGASCTDITGATSSSYTVQSSDIGHSLAAVITAHVGGRHNAASSPNTAAAASSTVGSSLISAAYLLGFQVPTGCSSLNATCITTTDPPNWSAFNQAELFTLRGATPVQDATTSAAIAAGSTMTAIPVTTTSTTIPAGPIMLTTSASNPSSGGYQVLQTSGASSGATSIPITGSPTASASYAGGAAVMVQPLDTGSESLPSGATMTSLVSAIHGEGATAVISIGGSDDAAWDSDCANGFQYLLGAALSQYMTTYGLDGVEIDDEIATYSNFGACWTGIGDELHATATAAGHVPIVYADINVSLGPGGYFDGAAASQTELDQVVNIYYGYNPANDYNCANSCSEVASWVSQIEGTPYDVPAQKLVLGQGVAGAGGAAQQQTTVLTTTSAQASGSVSSIPVSALSATMPAGTFVLASTDGPPPSSDEILETSGAASGATSIPVTGYCNPAGWTTGSGNCHDAGSVTLNATYASGDDIYQDGTGYTTPAGLGANSSVGAYNLGGWDCGNNAAYAAAHNLLGVMEWFYDGSGNTQLCADQIQPFVSGGFGASRARHRR